FPTRRSSDLLDEAERCDRVALLDRGRTLALDSPTALQRSFSAPLVAIRASDPRRARDVLRAQPVVRSAVRFGKSVHAVLADGADLASSTKALVDAGIDVLDAHTIRASLEDFVIDRDWRPERAECSRQWNSPVGSATSRQSIVSASRSRRARCSGSWDRTARARRRRSAC